MSGIGCERQDVVASWWYSCMILACVQCAQSSVHDSSCVPRCNGGQTTAQTLEPNWCERVRFNLRGAWFEYCTCKCTTNTKLTYRIKYREGEMLCAPRVVAVLREGSGLQNEIPRKPTLRYRPQSLTPTLGLPTLGNVVRK